MKKYRILLLTHKTLVPPENLSGLSDSKIDDFRTEYDVRKTLRRVGHDVRVVGVGDHLTELRETIDEWRPHVVFNLLDEFQGIISHDYYVVAYLELIQQRYTGCNPRGMMLSRDKVLAKRVLASHGVATPAFRVFPFGRRYRQPSRLTFPLFVKSATEDASLGISQASRGRGRAQPARARAIHPRPSRERRARRGIRRRPRDLRRRARQYAAHDRCRRGK